ncbi:MAG: hypothetical protein DRJ42_17520 [Deltaproteobacteria bacterium]|nr:MAG: hypothetical protein DRJ42_17520 [Deltaproteobacteria bacterium]
MAELTVLERYDLDIDEASGLAYHPEENALYVVSDEKGRVLRVALEDFSSEKIRLEGAKKRDCEGIAISPDQDELWVAAEQKRRILRFGLDGSARGKVNLDLSGHKNAGLEGLAVDPSTRRVYAVHERKPRLLLTYDDSFHELDRTPIDDVDDLSGVAACDGVVWIVSDASQALLRLVPTEDGWQNDGRWLLEGTKAEGIAVVGDRIYIAYDERLPGGYNLVAYARPE